MQNIAWTYDGTIWKNPQGIPASGFTGVLIRRYEIDAGTANLCAKHGLKDVWIECDTADQVRQAQMLFGTSFRGVYLPDEPNNKLPNGTWAVSVERLTAIAAAVRSAGPVPLWLNVIARSDALSHVRAVMPEILSCSLYLNCSGDCGFCNSVDDLRSNARVVLNVFQGAGLDDSRHKLGLVYQAFEMQRCNRPTISPAYLTQIWRAAHGVWGARIGLVSGYAWKPDDSFDGHMPPQHPDLWPDLKGLAEIIEKDIAETPPSEGSGGGAPAEFRVTVPAGVKRVVLDLA